VLEDELGKDINARVLGEDVKVVGWEYEGNERGQQRSGSRTGKCLRLPAGSYAMDILVLMERSINQAIIVERLSRDNCGSDPETAP